MPSYTPMMSDSEDATPELPLTDEPATTEAKPKKKTTRKRATKKRAAPAADAGASESGEAATGTASGSGQEPAPAASTEAALRPRDEGETFSFSPDEVDDYGDRAAREERKANESSEDTQGNDRAGESQQDDGNRTERRDDSAQAETNDGANREGGRPADAGGESQRHGGEDSRGSRGGGKFDRKREKFDKKKKFEKGKGQGGPGPQGGGNQPPQQQSRRDKFKKGKGGKRPHWQNDFAAADDEELDPPVTDALAESGLLVSDSAMETFRDTVIDPDAESLDYTELSALKLGPLVQEAEKAGLEWEGPPSRRKLLTAFMEMAAQTKRPVQAKGVVEIAEEGYGFIVFAHDNYRLKTDSPYLAPSFITRNVIQRGHEIEADLHPPMGEDTCPFVSKVHHVMGKTPDEIEHLTPFKELTAYYPTQRIVMEAEQGGLKKWYNISMRLVDLLSTFGLGQRALIV
ncbi:MAG: hypothetical protein ACFB21_05615, partial [Opitutales bacterium]